MSVKSTRGERAGEARRSVYVIFVPIGREVLEYTWKMQRERGVWSSLGARHGGVRIHVQVGVSGDS